ncbi:MAG: efflux RND transporter permease subunit, partial [Melioribacteraceae bacterium]|nr:efflux RND transporter permease subunit [Melioribacteraceae bacterium]
LGGLALGAGMLVDNAIVVMENIYRNIENGLSLKEASIQGAAQVAGAITASTITTIVVFLPIVYLHGASGELFKDQAWTVAFSLISSLFVAIMVIPVLSAKMLKGTISKKSTESVQFKGYSNLLEKFILKRWTIIPAALILVILSILLIPYIGSEFMPKSDSNEITINITLAEGTDLNRTATSIVSLENLLTNTFNEKIKYIYSQAGPTVGIESNESTFFENENTGFIKLIFNDDETISQTNLVNQITLLLTDIPELEFSFSFSETSLATIAGADEAPIVIEVKGDDLEILENLTEEVISKIIKINSISNIESSFEKGAPEVEVVIDRLKTGLYNISVAEISSQLSDILKGKASGTWDYEGELNDITIKLPDVTLKQLDDIKIFSGNNEYRLSELAEITFSNSPKEIHRRNQNRIGKITAQITDDKSLDHIAKEIEAELGSITLPTNYKIEITGEEELRAESMRNLTFALLLSIILVYMALASQFESLIHPFTILLTIPLAGVGAVLIFAILGLSFNIMAYIGIIMLTGIAVNDSIILVDAITQLKKEGLERLEAIVTAGQRRIRPIIM